MRFPLPRLAPAVFVAARMAICQACPFAEIGKNKKYFCGKCGCVLEAKTRLAGEQCPVGKWSPSTTGATK